MSSKQGRKQCLQTHTLLKRDTCAPKSKPPDARAAPLVAALAAPEAPAAASPDAPAAAPAEPAPLAPPRAAAPLALLVILAPPAAPPGAPGAPAAPEPPEPPEPPAAPCEAPPAAPEPGTSAIAAEQHRLPAQGEALADGGEQRVRRRACAAGEGITAATNDQGARRRQTAYPPRPQGPSLGLLEEFCELIQRLTTQLACHLPVRKP